jgi:hypothetical protein
MLKECSFKYSGDNTKYIGFVNALALARAENHSLAIGSYHYRLYLYLASGRQVRSLHPCRDSGRESRNFGIISHLQKALSVSAILNRQLLCCIAKKIIDFYII